jgi:hypothetical protein
LNNIHAKLAIHFSPEDEIVKNYLYLSKLAAQMVTSTPLESTSISLQLYESQNRNFNFGTTKTLIFFKVGHLIKIWSKKNIFNENPVEVRIFDLNLSSPLMSTTYNFLLQNASSWPHFVMTDLRNAATKDELEKVINGKFLNELSHQF